MKKSVSIQTPDDFMQKDEPIIRSIVIPCLEQIIAYAKADARYAAT